MAFLLSILIPSIPERAEHLEALLAECYRQAAGLPVEIIPLVTPHVNKGGPNIPKKRNLLYAQAAGKYSVQVDDDDTILPGMVAKVLALAQDDWNCITYDIRVIEWGGLVTRAHVNGRFQDWNHLDQPDGYGYKYYQGPYFKVPIETAICRRAGVNEKMNMGEDHDFMKRVSPMLQRCVHINDELYEYRAPDPREGAKKRYGV